MWTLLLVLLLDGGSSYLEHRGFPTKEACEEKARELAGTRPGYVTRWRCYFVERKSQ